MGKLDFQFTINRLLFMLYIRSLWRLSFPFATQHPHLNPLPSRARKKTTEKEIKHGIANIYHIVIFPPTGGREQKGGGYRLCIANEVKQSHKRKFRLLHCL
ncbi:hypothetical protein DRP43_03360 [candidate division TA06 bacterium]|uniref:Uncharacterized protein n=1 Tax=candidate division TA06 bacterium TaxID=2250710 RepID=A0A660SK63_UNCT6|nr:MAG: hypothetical protein DRP43_03360 [candidate division TA06 bacterium]